MSKGTRMTRLRMVFFSEVTQAGESCENIFMVLKVKQETKPCPSRGFSSNEFFLLEKVIKMYFQINKCLTMLAQAQLICADSRYNVHILKEGYVRNSSLGEG